MEVEEGRGGGVTVGAYHWSYHGGVERARRTRRSQLALRKGNRDQLDSAFVCVWLCVWVVVVVCIYKYYMHCSAVVTWRRCYQIRSKVTGIPHTLLGVIITR